MYLRRLLPLLPLCLVAADAPPAIHPEAAAIPPLPLTWSSRFMDTTPVGDVRFHGAFGKETLTVSSDILPPHEILDIRVVGIE